MKEINDILSKPDRLLGDEWLNWTGNLDESTAYNETARLFTLFAAIAILILLSSLGVILYMIEPRLNLLHPLLVYIARTVIIAIIIAFASIGILTITSVFTGKNFLYNSRLGQIAATRILPFAHSIAQRLGIPAITVIS